MAGSIELPCPTVRFGADYLPRLERMTVRFRAIRERREGAGRAALAGGGEEFVGSRPYRPGEDLRLLDWDLLARLDRPYVRVTRREASERWAIMLDTSASMGVGPPGKLQASAEAAGAFASVALRTGAQVDVIESGRGRRFGARRPTDLPGLLGFLEGLVAEGDFGLGARLSVQRPAAECGRVFLVGDLLDLHPRDVPSLRTPGRELFCVQRLAPVELAPPEGRAVEWLDPEGGDRALRTLDASTLARYERRLEEWLEAWDRLAARHGFSYGLFPSDRPFEDVVRETLAP